MKKLLTITACSIPLVFGSAAFAQTTAPADTTTAPGATAPATAPAGTTMTGADAKKEMVSGWSIKDTIMGKNVHNENDDKVGDIRDVILDDEGQATYYVIGAGGFLGLGEHDVAIPFDKVQRSNDKYMLMGYTKDQLKDLPKVEVRK